MGGRACTAAALPRLRAGGGPGRFALRILLGRAELYRRAALCRLRGAVCGHPRPGCALRALPGAPARSEEHTSELQSLMRISYAVFCLKKKKTHKNKKAKDLQGIRIME